MTLNRRSALGLMGGTLAHLALPNVLAQTPVPGAMPPEFMGLTVGTELNWRNWRDKLLPLYRNARIPWLRVWYNWASMERQPGVYGDGLTMQSLQLAKDWGFKILYMIWGTPGHAGNGALADRPDPDALGRYCDWLRVNMRGLVDAWEIGNEPNLSKYYAGSAADYVRTLAVAYEVLSGNGTVVAAGPSGGATPEYWQSMIDAGLEQHCDRVNLHPYRNQPDQVLRMVDDFRSRVQKPLWITELGLPNSVGGEEGKAAFARQLIPALSQRVEKLFWYRSLQMGTLESHNYGIIEGNPGTRNVTPLPIYYVIRGRQGE